MGLPKGRTNNPNGRPVRAEIKELRKALKEAETEKGRSFIKDYVLKSYDDTPRAVALLRKLLPDLSEGDLGDNAADVLKQITLVVKPKEGK